MRIGRSSLWASLLATACAGSEATAGGDDPAYFATAVVSFAPGPCAGFGGDQTPSPALGPPNGGGPLQGGLDVVSLGKGGAIVVTFASNAIVDGPGPDFIVFENPFFIGGDANLPSAELGEVSVSDDGVTWSTFPCTATTPPYGACAGWRPVLTSESNGVSARDPSRAGGDAFDLADVGVTRARFVRIVDKSTSDCVMMGSASPKSFGFDLDAVAIVHAER